MERWMIVGGRFRGIVAAHLLAKANRTVTVVERGQALGGIMSAVQWDDFYLDLGCHLFDNVDEDGVEIMHQIMGTEVVPVQVKYASVTDGVKQDGLAIPDYTGVDRAAQAQILLEMVEAATAGPQDHETPVDLLRHRYGATLEQKLCAAPRKIFKINPKGLGPLAAASMPFQRVRIFPDEMALVLKESPTLDALITASSQRDPFMFYRDK